MTEDPCTCPRCGRQYDFVYAERWFNDQIVCWPCAATFDPGEKPAPLPAPNSCSAGFPRAA